MIVRLAAGLVLAALSVAVSAQPACDPKQGCAADLSAPDVFGIAERYANAGRVADAEVLLKGLTGDLSAQYRAEARFRLSLLREAQGDRLGAIEWLKALLDEQPGAARPRLELARLLAATGDESGARRELRRAGAAGLPDDVARIVDQFALALRSSRTLGGSFEIAIAPDSNINRATTQDRVDTVIAPLTLSRDAQAQSSIGVSLSAQGFARGELGGGVTLLSRVSGRADLYGKSRFNDVALTLASGPEFQTGGARFRPAAIAQRRWFGGDLFSESYGGSLNVLKPLDRVSQIEGELTVLENRYANIPMQNGTLTDLNIAYDRAFSPRFSGRISVRGNRQDAQVEPLSSTGFGLELLASRAIGKQLIYLQASASTLTAKARDPFFGVRREDKRFDLTAGIVLRRFTFRGLAPLVRITHSNSDSTIPIYDFKRTRMEFALSREF